MVIVQQPLKTLGDNLYNMKNYFMVLVLFSLLVMPVVGYDWKHCDSSWQYEANLTTGYHGDTYIQNWSIYPDTVRGYENNLYVRYQPPNYKYDTFIAINNSILINNHIPISAVLNLSSSNANYVEFAKVSICNDSMAYQENNISINNRPICTNVIYSNVTLNATLNFPHHIVNGTSETFNVTDLFIEIWNLLESGETWIWFEIEALSPHINVMQIGSKEYGLNLSYGVEFSPLFCYNLEPTTNITEIEFYSPLNQTYNTPNIDVKFKPTNEVLSAIPCFYYVNDIEYSAGNVTNATNYTNNIAFPIGQQSNVYVKCENEDSSYSQTDRTYFYVNALPDVNLVYLQTSYSQNNSIIEFAFITNDTDDSVLDCYYKLDNTTYPNFNVNTPNAIYKTIGGLADGEHNLTVNCTDSKGVSDFDYEEFEISVAPLELCFYTYSDYDLFINNNSLSWGGGQAKPNAVRDIILFNDSLGKVWAVQQFRGLPTNYYCKDLINGCVNLTLYSTANYKVYIADNVDFNSDCKPNIHAPRYYEYVGEFFVEAGEGKTENWFISFEDSTNLISSANTILEEVRQLLFIFAGFSFVAVGAYLGMLSGSGIATIGIIAILLFLLFLIKDFILSGGLI